MARKPAKPAELKLRIPRGLHQMIETAARQNERSLNQEAILRLQQSFVQQGVEAMIESAALKTAIAIVEPLQNQIDDIVVQLVKMEKGKSNG